MNDLLKRLHPLSIFFFGFAVIAVFIGLITGFQYRVLHVIVVVSNVVVGLLCQWKYEMDDKA